MGQVTTLETTRAAALAIEPIAPAILEQVFALIRSKGLDGCTADEIEAQTGIKGDTIRPRICTLREQGRIESLGEVRKTRSGRMAVVWVATGELS